MPFQKGHKLSTGRPKGATNKELTRAKKILTQIIFNKEQLIDDLKELLFNPIQLTEDFNNLDVKGRMEFRCRMAKFVVPEQKQLEVESTTDIPRLSLADLTDVYNADENQLPRHT